jgi:Tfp pilus assembly protein PilF
VAQREAAEGNVTGAIRTLENSLVEYPDDDLTRIQLARLYAKEKSANSPRRLSELFAGRRDFFTRHLLLAILSVGEGRRQEATDECRAAMKLAPNDSIAACNYALLMSGDQNVRAAIDACQNVLRIDPSDRDAHGALAQLYLRVGDPASAHRHEDYLRRLDEWNR